MALFDERYRRNESLDVYRMSAIRARIVGKNEPNDRRMNDSGSWAIEMGGNHNSSPSLVFSAIETIPAKNISPFPSIAC